MPVSRHDLKRNELADIVVASAEWIRNNRTTFLSAAAIAAGALLFALFFFARFHTLKARAQEKYSVAQAQIYQGQIQQGLGLLDEVIRQYPSTDAAAKARLLKADYLTSQGKYAEAEPLVRDVTVNGKPAAIVPLSFASLGVVQESQGKFADAIKTYNAFMEKYPDHFLAPKVLEGLARSYELLGDATNAVQSYEKLSALYPNTGWSQRAQERLAVLSRQQPPAPLQAPAPAPANPLP